MVRLVLITLFCLPLAAVGGLTERVWLDVPYVRQAPAGCGSASIAMVMQYWVREDKRIEPGDADEARIHAAVKHTAEGIRGEALRDYLTGHGFAAYVFRGTTEDLRHHLAKGRPIVVCLAPRGAKAPRHYVVVAGVDDDAVLVNDPTRGKLVRQALSSFTKAWELTGNWSLLAVPAAAQR